MTRQSIPRKSRRPGVAARAVSPFKPRPTCPACGSLNTQWKIYLLMARRCLDCGHRWMDMEYAEEQEQEYKEFLRRNPEVEARSKAASAKQELEGWKNA